MKITPNDIANYFILLSDGSDLTNLKIQKLIYYAYGIYLARHNKHLFKESIEAWQYGPVIPSLYHEFKQYKKQPVPLSKDFDANKFDDDLRKFLQEIYLKYGEYDAKELCELSHEHSTPWYVVYNDNTNDPLINDSLINVYFTELEKLLSQKTIDQIKAAKILAQDTSLVETMYVLSHPKDAQNLKDAMNTPPEEAVEIEWMHD